MKNADYWRGRALLLENALNSQGAAYVQTLDQEFKLASTRLQKDIEAFYHRFAANNEISLADAKKWLNAGQLQEFKWSVKDYIKYGEEHGLDPVWVKKLENASDKVHISRLDALQMELQQQTEALYGNHVDGLDRHLRHVYGEAYYHNAFEIQKGFQIGWDLPGINARQLEAAIKRPWSTDGQTFRDRCWKDKTALVNSVQTNLIQAIIRGDPPDRVTKLIADKFKVSTGKAARLVMTENAYFSSQAQKECFHDLDVEKFEIVETLDSHTCDICGEFDGDVLPMTDFEAGVTAPPFHPWCRGCTAPWFADNYGDRAARDQAGQVYYVPADMKFKDWKKTFADGGAKDGLTVAKIGDIIKEKRDLVRLAPDMFPDYLTSKTEAKNTQAMIDYVNGCENADPDVVALYAKMGQMENIAASGIPINVTHTKGYAVNYRYNRNDGHLIDTKLIIPKLTGENLTGQIATTLHEEMHLMDMFNRADAVKYSDWFSPSSPGLSSFFKAPNTDIADHVTDLFDAFDKECEKISSSLSAELRSATSALTDQYYAKTLGYADYKKARNKIIRETEAQIEYQCGNAMGGGIGELEDIYDALSGGTARDTCVVHYGHGSKYYRNIESRSEETLANYGALSIVRPDLIELLKTDKPDLVEALGEAIQELLKKAGG